MSKWDFDIDGLMPSSIGFYAAPTLFMKDWDQWLEKVSLTHSFITVFPFQLADDDPYANRYQPYKDGKKRKFWWRRYRRFIRLAASNGITIIPIGYSKYQSRAFPRIYSDDRSFFLHYWEDLVARHMKDCPYPRFRFSNEVGRKGWIGEYGPNAMNLIHLHEDMYEIAKTKGAKLEGFHMDVSGSDFCKCEEPGYLLQHKMTHAYKPVMVAEYQKWPLSEKIKWDIESMWGRYLYDRRGGIEWHQASLNFLHQATEPTSGTTYVDVMNGAWQWFVLNLDGCTDLSGYQVPGTPWTGPTNEELKSWCHWAFKRGDAWLEYFPMSIFVLDGNGVLIEDKDLINWDQLEIMYAEFVRARE